MKNSNGEHTVSKKGSGTAKVLLLAVIIVAWVALDQLTKAALGVLPEGTRAGSIPGGLVDLILVHNTGAAWGVFSGNPMGLALFSLVVCVVLLVYMAFNIKDVNMLQVVGIALVVAGGIGNAIDRFTHGYVIDFFATTFMDFPVFNVADIGVTCGVVLFLLGFIFAGSRNEDGGSNAKTGVNERDD